MYEVNFNAINDKAMDVDPDLRFMALQDFQKYLNQNKGLSQYYNHYIGKFIPVLFRLLQDQNTDVQSQAVNSFEPLVGFVPDDVLLEVIEDLFTKVNELKTEGFTTSIPNMALRSMLNCDEAGKFTAKLQRQICNLLIPRLMTSRCVDSLEILNDLINNFGAVLVYNEVTDLSKFLISVSFCGLGIVSKLAVVGFESLTKHMMEVTALNKAITFILDGENVTVRLQLYSIVFKSPLLVENDLKNKIYQGLLYILSANEQYLDDDIDFDKILESNLLKEDALTVLNDLVNSNNDIHDNQKEIFNIISHFVNYDPLNSNVDEIEDDNQSDMVEFSDDENDEDYTENDGSWKLRIKAAILLRSYLDKFQWGISEMKPVLNTLPIDDCNELVSSEAIKTAIKIIDLVQDSYDEIKYKILNKLLVETKIFQFPKTLKLIESLKNKKLIELTFDKFSELNVTTRGSMDYLNFYKNILQFELSDNVINYILQDVAVSIEDKSLNVTKESIKVLTTVVRTGYKVDDIDGFVDVLVSKISNSRVYPSDILQLCIVCASEIVAHRLAPSGKIIEAFKSSLAVDSCVKTIIENLIMLLKCDAMELSNEYQQFLISKLSQLLLSNDDYLSSASLQLLKLVLESGFVPDDSDSIVQDIIKVLGWGKPITVEFDILRLLLAHSVSHREEFLGVLVKLINKSRVEDDVAPSLYALFKTISNNTPGIYEYLFKELDPTLFVSAKVLAIISIEHNLTKEIETRERQLIAQLKDTLSISNNELLFNIQYLANISETVNLNLVQVSLLIQFLNAANTVQLSKASKSEENAVITNEEVVKSAIATFIGIITKRNMDGLELLIESYRNNDNTKTRIYLVSALRIVLPQCSSGDLGKIWTSIIESISKLKFEHSFAAELRNSADVISDICLIEKNYIHLIINQFSGEETEKLAEIYTLIIVVKDLVNQLEKSEENEVLLNQLILLIMNYIGILNIDIRQAIIGTLLTSLHNRSGIILPNLNEVILPRLYTQLTAEVSFKKVIQMGPYKYVIDEGMEIRKLIYEFLYTISSFDSKTVEDNQINREKIGKNIIQQGLADEQIDIIVLSCINLINFIANQQEIFFQLLVKDNGSVLKELIEKLTVSLNKKLSPKASSQDVENYQERLKGVIKLSKKIEQTFHLSNKDKNLQIDDLVNSWNVYYDGLKQNFLQQFNQIET
jgi:cullin-associated NEDD8-dissociated protein 1